MVTFEKKTNQNNFYIVVTKKRPNESIKKPESVIGSGLFNGYKSL
jgi:hypothetical protein